ncbi:MAG: hypothetical protein LUH82_04665 [Clostridiales bacterium]|nr:hypothetical protein [Clostridiales bacterium]
MKKMLKKLPALLLAAIMLCSTMLPFSALADDSEAVATALASFESAMASIADELESGTAYCGISEAYDLYVQLATEGGTQDEADALVDFANSLYIWSAATFSATAYHEATVATSGYSNVVYASTSTSWGSSFTEIDKIYMKLAVPETIVMAYDGITTPSSPIVFENYANGSNSQRIQYIEPSTTATLPEDTGSSYSSILAFNDYWYGHTDGYTYGVWPGDTITSSSYTDYFGYSSAMTQITTNAQTNTNTHRFWWNRLYYTGTGNTDTYYDNVSNVSFDVNGKNNSDSYETTYAGLSTSNAAYVINYAPIIENAAVIAARLGAAINENGVGSYTMGGLSELIAALDAFTSGAVNPKSYDYSTDAATAVSSCATAIKTAVETYASAQAGYTDSEAAQAVEDAMASYESAMDSVAAGIEGGTYYTNLTAAYEAYIAAAAALDSYTYGGNTAVNLITAAQELTAATNSIAEWQQSTFDGTVYHQGSVNAAGDYYSNVIYSSTITNWATFTSSDSSNTFKIVGPTEMVLAYDGENEVIMPIALEIFSHVSSMGAFRVYTAYSDSALFSLNENWQGANASYNYLYFPTDTESGQASTTNAASYQNLGTSESDYSAYTEKDANGFLGNKYYFNTSFDFTNSASGYYYTDYVAHESGSSETWNIGWKDGGSTVTIDSSALTGDTYSVYVINYVPVITNTQSLSSALAAAITSAENGAADYLEGGLADLLAAIDSFTAAELDPMDSSYNYSSDTAAAVSAYSSALSAAVSSYSAAAAGDTDGSGYDLLVAALTSTDVDTDGYDSYTLAEQYAAGNDAGEDESGNAMTYTTASWAAFTAAYEAALSIEYNLTSTNYTDNSGAEAAATALTEAYNALNVASSQSTGAVINTFTPAAAAGVTVNETFNQNTYVKTDVSVTNDADTGYSTYIRANIVASWVNDTDSSILALNDVNQSGYTLTTNLGADDNSDGGSWFYCDSDGYYYYSVPVAAGASTDVLITECYATSEIDGYHLEVQIIAQSVQSAGMLDDGTAYFAESDWGVTVAADKSISKS